MEYNTVRPTPQRPDLDRLRQGLDDHPSRTLIAGGPTQSGSGHPARQEHRGCCRWTDESDSAEIATTISVQLPCQQRGRKPLNQYLGVAAPSRARASNSSGSAGWTRKTIGRRRTTRRVRKPGQGL